MPSTAAAIGNSLRAIGCLALILALILLAASSQAPLQAEETKPQANEASERPSQQTLQFVREKVQPLLQSRCYKCHGPEVKAPKGSLRLDSRSNILAGGDTGAAIKPGNPGESLLIESINWRGDYEMPPKSKLPAGEIAILTKWVELGAPWPDDSPVAEQEMPPFPLQQRRASHWSWQPITPHARPEVKDQQWPLNTLDYFVLQKLESRGLTPNPTADRRVLIRRAYYDCIGLPPSPEEVAQFLADTRPLPQAFAEVVDRLLQSPHFGERWARHWLDVVRYAESRGHEFDHPAANAYHFRDYVIRAFNADLPFDQFVVEQLAGDLLVPPRVHPKDGFNESVLGTGFWYLGDWVHSPTDIRQDEADRIDNMIDTLGRAFLGMTIACARCHDHKFDAISTKDYYALAGFAQSTRYRQVRFDALEHNRKIAEQLRDLDRQQENLLRKTVASSLAPGIAQFADYLQAAREVLRGKSEEQAAGSARLDANRLHLLLTHLRKAREDVQDPLHGWALLCYEKTLAPEARWLQTRKALSQPWETEEAANQQAWRDFRVVVDYAKTSDADWAQDGFAFGMGPKQPGMLHFATSAEQPLSGVYTAGFARRDPLWRGLSLASGVEQDPGAIGGIPRSGQTLCSPTFTIESGTLHYYLKGAAKIQAVVDSHRMIAGPLHGSLIKSTPASAQPQWVSHGLDRYIGHRAHIEFVPADEGDLEIYMIVDGKPRPPALPRPRPLTLELLDNNREGNQEDKQEEPNFAEQLQRKLREVCRVFETNGSPNDVAESARWADWLVRHRHLFTSDKDSLEKTLAQATGEYLARRTSLADQIRKTSRTAIAAFDGTGENEFLLIRGRSSTPGELVPRRLLEALAAPEPAAYEPHSGRLTLARQMVDARNPLLARVIVNRIWHHLTGRGIVPTPDNFGVLGRPPSHPELLDQLAIEFVQEGWSIKRMIREIMLSRTYQMSSSPLSEQAETLDPDNVLLHRMRVRRLEAEAIRDAMLQLSGRLDPALEGPSVPVHVTSFMTGRGRPQGGPLDGAGRRSIYVSIRRNFLSPMMLAFDMPIPSQPAGRRNVSNVPAQALILMNDPFVKQQAESWAKRMLEQHPVVEDRIRHMYQLAYCRDPDVEEVAASVEFLRQQAGTMELAADQWTNHPGIWTDFAHVLWNVKEFIFIN